MTLVPVVVLSHQSLAYLFSSYLKQCGIISKVEQQPQGYCVFCDAEQLTKAQAIFQEFIKNPHDKKYQQAAWQLAEEVELAPESGNSPGLLQAFLSHAGAFTLLIFVGCWLVFLLSLFGLGYQLFQHLHFYPVLSFELLLQEPWRMISPALFHFGWLHIVFNTLWWWQLGGDVEKKLSSGTLVQLFLISAILSNTGQFFATGANFAGLSGVVYALVGFCWLLAKLRPQTGLVLSDSMFGLLIVWMLLGMLDVLPVNMANTAHFLGLVSGLVLAGFQLLKQPTADRKLNH